MKINTIAIVNPWKTDRNPALAGYTGRLFEDEVLGTCQIRAKGYVYFRSALNAVLNNQPGNPFEPKGEAGNFRAAVASAMEAAKLDPCDLMLYTAIGSALDRYHGIDGFFWFEGIIVTVDVTMNPHKDEDCTRSRVLVRADDAFAGYPEASAQIAGWFNRGLACKWKGVI